MLEIKSMFHVPDFFIYAQEEDYSKLGITLDVSDEDEDDVTLLASSYENDLQLVRDEEKNYVAERNSKIRVLRRMQTRYALKRKRAFIKRVKGLPNFCDSEAAINEVRPENENNASDALRIQCAAPIVGRDIHSDRWGGLEIKVRKTVREIRREDKTNRKKYLGVVNSKSFCENYIEIAVDETVPMVYYKRFEDRFSDSEKAIIAEAAKLLRLAVWYLYDEAEYAENSRKKAFQLEKENA